MATSTLTTPDEDKMQPVPPTRAPANTGVFRYLEPSGSDVVEHSASIDAPVSTQHVLDGQMQDHRPPAAVDAEDVALSAQLMSRALRITEQASPDEAPRTAAGELGGVAHTVAGADVMPGGTDDKQGQRIGASDAAGHAGTSREERLLIPSLLPSSATGSHPKASSGTKQAIYLPADDLQLFLTFHSRPIWRQLIWSVVVLLTVGVAWIVAFYAPRFWLRINCSPAVLVGEEEQKRASKRGQIWVAVKTAHEPLALVRLKERVLSEPVLRSNVFTKSLRLPPADVLAHTSGAARPQIDSSTHANESVTMDRLSLLSYRSVSLLLTPIGFVPLGDWRDSSWTSKEALLAGLSADEGRPASWRRTMFGSNEIIVETKSWGRLTVDEALHPFYIFSLCSIALWSYDEYQWYALVIGVISIAGIAASVITAKRALQRLQRMSRFECDVSVLRPAGVVDEEKSEQHTKWEIVRSTELLPGDVVDVASVDAKLNMLPCDCLLLESEAISSEAMLTGEAVPVAKSACPTSLLLSVLSTGQPFSKLDKHLLYGGTQIVRSRPGPSSDGSAKALVLQTGFETTKGSLVRQMLFPKPLKHHFYADAFKFIGILALIAFCGFIGSLVYFITIGVDRVEIALRALDLFTICVPPALPAAMSVCTSLAIARLRVAGIFVTSPARINVAGKTSCVVFDKTGTLTEAHLDVLGVRSAAVRERAVGKLEELSPLLKTIEELKHAAEGSIDHISLAEALATAHDLNMLDGNTIGEPLEQSMFAWTGATLDDEAAIVELQVGDADAQNPNTRPAHTSDGSVAKVPVVRTQQAGKDTCAVVRKFAFESNLRRMSVVVKRQREVGARVYAKGAPEAIGPLCKPQSLPTDFEAVLDEYTHKGFRVLALAGKSISELAWRHAQGLARSQAESELSFLGLLVFENPLKEGTRSALARLHSAGLPTKMCTGDGLLTGIAVACDAEMISPGMPVFAARLTGGGEKQKRRSQQGSDPKQSSEESADIEWYSVSGVHGTLDPYSLRPLNTQLRLLDVALALTGDTFTYLLQHAARETLERILVRAQVFARFSPEQKQELVERLQGLQYTVSFVGDGANDVGALKAADVGLSLSEAEASVAAPFTSKDADIGCIDHLIREGRNSLCTSLNLFSWMLVYSLAEFWSVTLLYTVATSFDNAEYLYIDVLIVLPIAIGMANNRPASQLSSKRPPSRLMSRRVVLSLLSQMVLLILAQATVYLLLHRQHDFYEAPILDPENLELSDQDNTVLFKTSTFTYIIAAIIYSWGPPHRQHVWKNWFLSLAIVTITAFNLAFLFINSDGPFFSLFAFHTVPLRFLFVILGVVLIQGLLAFAVEILLIDRAAAALQPPVESFRRWKLSNRKAKAEQKAGLRLDPSTHSAAIADDVDVDRDTNDTDARKAHRRIVASIEADP